MDTITFRSFKKGDYEMCCEWWNWWWGPLGVEPVKRSFLPKDERCFIIENNNVPVACTFLFLAYDVPMLGWTSYLISNPEYKNRDRREIIKLLIKGVEEEAEKHGIIRLYTVCGDKHISDIHESLEWDMIPVRFEAFKTIQNNLDKLINNNYG